MPIEDTGTATSVRVVTPNDTTVVNCRGIYVGGAGNVAVTAMEDNAASVFLAVPAGTVLPVAARYIMATGTTATNMLALY